MKVLFAVSNDNITTSVVSKYQQKFKEIITSKNVYYFNAIIKELQNDKNYDAIVIGEDLEPIANNNYEAIDKFLIEKLDSISDEAFKPSGEDIPIIFICADRRTKTDEIIKKLFSMSMYNALLGNDRSLDMVCNLINKPRNKKEAKRYYELDLDGMDVYNPNSDNEGGVPEEQIQNILSYFKKIGNNEKKCVQAFDSISKQYDEAQLRIIIKFLPIDVKAILESSSVNYQKIMEKGTVLSGGKGYNSYKNNKLRLNVFSKPYEKPKGGVVIPSNMNIQNVKMNNTVGQPRKDKIVVPAAMNKPVFNNNTNGNINPNISANSNPNSNTNMNIIQNNRNNVVSDNHLNNNSINGVNKPIVNPLNRNNVNPYNGLNTSYQSPYNNMGYNNMPYGNGMNSANLYQSQQQSPFAGFNNYSNNNFNNNFNNELNHKNENGNDNKIIEKNNLSNEIEKKLDNSFELDKIDNIYNENFNDLDKIGNIENIENVGKNEKIEKTENLDNFKPYESLDSIFDANPKEDNLKDDLEKNNESINLDVNLNNNIENEELKELPLTQDIDEKEKDLETVKRGRGRPRKVITEQVVPAGPKRGRGRPRKVQIVEENENDNELDNLNQNLNQINDVEIDVNKNDDALKNNETKNDFVDINKIEETNSLPFVQGETSINKIDDNRVNVNENKSNETKINEETFDFGDLTLNNELNDNIFTTNENVENVVNNKNIDLVTPIKEDDSNNTVDLFNLGIDDSNDYPEYKENSYKPYTEFNEAINNTTKQMTQTNEKRNNKADYSFNIAGNGKIVSFVGTTKNGTSFIVNNLAQLLSAEGIKTCIIDLTRNKNSYYLYTDNDNKKSSIASKSLEELSNGNLKGLEINNNLTLFTSLPEASDKVDFNIQNILNLVSTNFDIILLDCDFNTPYTYFVKSNETYLIQSMDAFTIQPLTKFLSDLKAANVLDETKLRVIINKYVKLRKVDYKMIVGGMSKYNEPSMTLQRDLFDSKTIQISVIPFDMQTYIKGLEQIAFCQVSLNGYSNEVYNCLKQLKNQVYPLIAQDNNGGKKIFGKYNNNTNKYNNEYSYKTEKIDDVKFNDNISSTLDKMRKNNY